MSQAIVNPEELRHFAGNLKQFDAELQSNMARLQAQYHRLGDTWRDQEHAKFAHRPRHRDLRCCLLRCLQVDAAEDLGHVACRAREHSYEVARLLDVAHLEPHREAVPQGLQFLLAGGYLVGGPDDASSKSR